MLLRKRNERSAAFVFGKFSVRTKEQRDRSRKVSLNSSSSRSSSFHSSKRTRKKKRRSAFFFSKLSCGAAACMHILHAKNLITEYTQRSIWPFCKNGAKIVLDFDKLRFLLCIIRKKRSMHFLLALKDSFEFWQWLCIVLFLVKATFSRRIPFCLARANGVKSESVSSKMSFRPFIRNSAPHKNSRNTKGLVNLLKSEEVQGAQTHFYFLRWATHCVDWCFDRSKGKKT